MSCAAIIPVRGGSVGVPKKNIRLLAGKPLLAHIVAAAHAARRIDFIIVSTEDEEIAAIAHELNVEVFRHPSVLSDNTASSFGVVQWVMQELERFARAPTLCVLLRATSPLCSSDDIDAAIALLESNAAADSVVSVVRAWGVHPTKLKRLGHDGVLEDIQREAHVPTRRQDLEPCYMRNAAIYVSKPSLISNGMLWGRHCLGYVMPENRSININSEIDFKLATLLMEEHDVR